MKFFGDLIEQPALSNLGQVESALGRELVRIEILRIEIESLTHLADRDRWQQTLAMLAVGLLAGAVIGCAIVSRAVGK